MKTPFPFFLKLAQPHLWTDHQRSLAILEMSAAALELHNLRRRQALLFHLTCSTPDWSWIASHGEILRHCSPEDWPSLPISKPSEHRRFGASLDVVLRYRHLAMHAAPANSPLIIVRRGDLPAPANSPSSWLDRQIQCRVDGTSRSHDEFKRAARLIRPHYLEGNFDTLLPLLEDEALRRVLAGVRIGLVVTPEMAKNERVLQVMSTRPAFRVVRSTRHELLAVECSHRALHVPSDVSHVDIVSLESSSPTESGRVLLTDLETRYRPNVRADTGVVATWIREPCPCGLPFPRIDFARSQPMSSATRTS